MFKDITFTGNGRILQIIVLVVAGKMKKAYADRFKPRSPNLTVDFLCLPEEQPDKAHMS